MTYDLILSCPPASNTTKEEIERQYTLTGFLTYEAARGQLKAIKAAFPGVSVMMRGESTPAPAADMTFVEARARLLEVYSLSFSINAEFWHFDKKCGGNEQVTYRVGLSGNGCQLFTAPTLTEAVTDALEFIQRIDAPPVAPQTVADIDAALALPIVEQEDDGEIDPPGPATVPAPEPEEMDAMHEALEIKGWDCVEAALQYDPREFYHDESLPF